MGLSPPRSPCLAPPQVSLRVGSLLGTRWFWQELTGATPCSYSTSSGIITICKIMTKIVITLITIIKTRTKSLLLLPLCNKFQQTSGYALSANRPTSRLPGRAGPGMYTKQSLNKCHIQTAFSGGARNCFMGGAKSLPPLPFPSSPSFPSPFPLPFPPSPRPLPSPPFPSP